MLTINLNLFWRWVKNVANDHTQIWKFIKHGIVISYPSIISCMVSCSIIFKLIHSKTASPIYATLIAFVNIERYMLLQNIRDLQTTNNHIENINNHNMRVIDNMQNTLQEIANATTEHIVSVAPHQPHVAFPNQIECTICCKKYGKRKPTLLSCGHKFHLLCIFNWFSQKNICPICRQKHVITSA